MNPKPDYLRLIKAAKAIRGWVDHANISRELTKNGFEVSIQTLGNWRSRGVSKDGLLRVSEILGVRSAWLETGIGEMADRGTDAPSELNQDRAAYTFGLSNEEKLLVDAYRLKPRHDQLNVLKLLDVEPEDFAQSA